MEEKKKIFSQRALDNLGSPDRLDTLFRVTEPIHWLSLLSVGIFIVSAAVWSVFGVIAVKVNGVGIITDPVDIVNVSHFSGGKISELFISEGHPVKKGDVIATLSIPADEEEVITKRYDMHSVESMRELASNISKYQSGLYKFQKNRQVVSDHSGAILELKVNKGDIIAPGQPIASLRRTRVQEGLRAIIYVSLADGKRVHSGLTVQLSPNNVDVSQTGTLVGVVRGISEFPVSPEGMVRRLGNASLVQWILNQLGGAAMEVAVDLVRDDKTQSGYLWSSVFGANVKVTPGTACKGMIIVEREPPIEKVFRKLVLWLRNDG